MCIVPYSPTRPKAHINLDTLSLKKKYLRLLIKFYEQRICWLSTDSRRYFGALRGKTVVVLTEDSSELGLVDCGKRLDEYKHCLKLFIKEQLQQKECVYLVTFGSRANPSNPQPLSFYRNRSQ